MFSAIEAEVKDRVSKILGALSPEERAELLKLVYKLDFTRPTRKPVKSD